MTAAATPLNTHLACPPPRTGARLPRATPGYCLPTASDFPLRAMQFQRSERSWNCWMESKRHHLRSPSERGRKPAAFSHFHRMAAAGEDGSEYMLSKRQSMARSLNVTETCPNVIGGEFTQPGLRKFVRAPLECSKRRRGD